MAWNGRGVTGSNNIPLGSRRRGGDDDYAGESLKRGRSPVRNSHADVDAAIGAIKRRKRRNRWGLTEGKFGNLLNMPTAVMSIMTSEQIEAYALHVRIEEISQKLRINDVVPAEGDRSPSPPPQYDNFGRRVNTRESRYRKKLEDERHKLVERALKTIPSYQAPADYRRPTKTQEKIYVPVNDYPEINFIGLLIGPRGNTLKTMESQSGAKIAIRGKGSVKEGKGKSDAAHTSNQEEDLHCLITADTEEKVDKAKMLVNNVIETAASTPETQNALKRGQLRELAMLNGTLRDDENQACQNCNFTLGPKMLIPGGEIGHRKYDCPQARNFTANIICHVCGNAGHMARDCTERRRGTDWRAPPSGPAGARPGVPGGPAGRITGGDAADREYDALMQELSGGAAPAGHIEAGPGGYDQGYGGGGGAPWKQGGGSAAPWANGGRGGGGGGAPWARGGGGGGGGRHDGYGDSSGGYGNQGGYGGGQQGGAPWQQGGGQGYGGGYDGGQHRGYDQYGGYPPPPPGEVPPPPPGDAPPPPPR